MKHLSLFEILFFLVVGFFCGNQWGCNPKTVTVTGDTTLIGYIKHDTVIIRKPVAKYVYVEKKQIIQHDTIYMSNVRTLLDDTIRTYSETYADSGVIIQVDDSINGYLIQQRARILTSLPVLMRVDTVYKTSAAKPRNCLYIGATIGNNQLYPSLFYTTKKAIFMGGYDIQNKALMFGAGIKLSLIRPRKYGLK